MFTKGTSLRLGEGKRPFYLLAIWEGFKTVGDETAEQLFINQVRVHAGFGHRLSPRFRYEVHYIWQKSRLLTDSGLETSQEILRIRLFHPLARKDN